MAGSDNWPEGLVLSWYGDDYTGSAVVMDVLTFAGLPSVLFLGLPTPAQRAAFADVRAIGIAGIARSRDPAWMEKNLPEIFRYLAELNTPVTHYKVCSTLDSGPRIGSIGKAIDIGAKIFSSPWIPLLVAAPPMRRYQAFGHLFASSPDGVRRLDRHPVMTRHPVTPMDEADVAAHIAKQTKRKFGLVDLESLFPDADANKALDRELESGAQIISLDAIDEATQEAAGRLMWTERGGGIFAVGSQGVEYALVSHWRSAGLLPRQSFDEGVDPVSRIVVVSGSVSSITAAQIKWAAANGFFGIRFEASSVAQGDNAMGQAEDNAVNAALEALDLGQDPMVYSAQGPDDPAVSAFHEALVRNGMDAEEGNRRIGGSLGRILNRILLSSKVSRAVICGGDTSGQAMAHLGVFALTAIAPTIAGAALCKAHSEDPDFASLEVALKGGQMGTPDFFDWIKRGGGVNNQRTFTS